MPKAINTKSNKNEILDAYHQTLEQIKMLKQQSKQAEKQEKDQQAVVTEATEHTAEGILQALSQVKLRMVRSFEQLEEQLLQEHKKLATLQQAIGFQTQELEALHGIKAEAEALTALVLTQQEKTSTFEKEMQATRQVFEETMQQKRAEWKKEQETMEASRKEQAADTQKRRQREEDEYLYQRDIARQKEEDAYTLRHAALERELVDKQAALEKAFAEREAVVAQSEQELKTLRERVASFPAQCEAAVAQAVASATAQLEQTTGYARQLLEKEREGEKKLYEQKVSALEAQSLRQAEQIKQLTEKANAAGLQVQAIAVKVIEGASRQVGYAERAVEAAYGEAEKRQKETR